jgi:hypothetical protein
MTRRQRFTREYLKSYNRGPRLATGLRMAQARFDSRAVGEMDSLCFYPFVVHFTRNLVYDLDTTILMSACLVLVRLLSSVWLVSKRGPDRASHEEGRYVTLFPCSPRPRKRGSAPGCPLKTGPSPILPDR